MRALLSAVRVALQTLARSKLRAGLTVLGVLIGVAAVVLVVALGTGAREKVLGEIATLGTNIVYVYPQATNASGAKQGGASQLNEADGVAIMREAPSVAATIPLSYLSAQVIAGDKNVSTNVMGTTRMYFPVRDYRFAAGASWTEMDELLKAKICVIGDTVRENLFGDRTAIGEYVRIGRHSYRVIGVLQKKGVSPFGEEQDDRVLMPLRSLRARVLPSKFGRVELLLVSATDERTVDRAVQQIDALLQQRHHIAAEDEPDFVIRTQVELRKTQEEILDTLQILLSSIAAVSLVVGGIGVMNIMLVSVAERTREIGIRMAIGAAEEDILLQFLIESVVLSVLGGLMGLLLGFGVATVAGRALGWSMEVPFRAVLAAVGTSTGVGIVFGFFPARAAARMDPIVALRDER